MVNILKKYCRAAGDRSQWKKVEAMFYNSEKRRERRSKSLGGAYHVARSPFVVLKAMGTHNANTDPLRDQDGC
jgi:hypothetical protein